MATPYDFKSLIEANETTREQMIADYQAYCGEGLDILSRTMPDTAKLNNKLANDFRGEIVDQAVGYLFGKPMTYSLEKEAYEGTGLNYDADNTEFDSFRRRIEIADLDAETQKRASIMGVTYRLCYIDGEGLENVSNIFPWQVVLIDEHNAFIYSQDAESNLYTVEHYDDVNITTYSENQDGTFSEVSQEPHMFTLMPIVEVVNNDEKLPEFRKVESLIDAYDRAVSDAQNELEEFRQAYMVVIGSRIDADTVALARASGAFSLLPDQQGDAVDMKFLTKDVNDTFLEHHKSTLRENIYRFSSTVDMTDQKFSGADQSGEARKWKLLALENKVAIHERKFAKALRQMFKVLSTAWQVKGFTLDWNNISWTFDRNIPLELSMEATTTQALKGNVAERTRLSLLSFVEDPERELEEMDTERQVDLDMVSGAINNDQNNEEQ